MKKVRDKWHLIIIVAVLLVELAVFLYCGKDHSYFGVHDNLDIHITDYKLLKDNNAFFSQDATIPLLGGLNRDFLLSEFYLYSLIYALLPNFYAYITGYFVKILVALISGVLLGRSILKDNYKEYEWAVMLGSFIYGLLPLYPAFSISFSSIPLLIYLIRKIEAGEGLRYYLFVFLYPILSYFTFFGIFIIGYLFVYFLYRSISSKKISLKLIPAIGLISIGYVLVEYRLFRLIFTSNESTIRDTMIVDNYSVAGIIKTISEVFVNNMFHCEDLHRFVVMPVVIISLFVIDVAYIKNKQARRILTDPLNGICLLICFNCVVYGLYYSYPVRTAFETLIPHLKGWQYNRTLFFNPFLWYLALIIVVIRLSKTHARLSKIVLLLAMVVVIGKQSLYNDFFNTVYVNAWQAVKGKESETLSYGDFFSEELFEKIKKDIDYKNEYCIAYGFHPSVLSYNKIATLDGCLSYYYQSYKDEFRNLIYPALKESETARRYYDEWGARAYIYSGTIDSVWSPTRTKDVDDHRLLINTDYFKDMNGKYIFSRIEVDNTDSLGLKLVGKYSDDSSCYTIWVYTYY